MHALVVWVVAVAVDGVAFGECCVRHGGAAMRAAATACAALAMCADCRLCVGLLVQGGVAYIDGSSTFTADSCTITGNSAVGLAHPSGGAVGGLA